jgi:hypothetical protein
MLDSSIGNRLLRRALRCFEKPVSRIESTDSGGSAAVGICSRESFDVSKRELA